MRSVTLHLQRLGTLIRTSDLSHDALLLWEKNPNIEDDIIGAGAGGPRLTRTP